MATPGSSRDSAGARLFDVRLLLFVHSRRARQAGRLDARGGAGAGRGPPRDVVAGGCPPAAPPPPSGPRPPPSPCPPGLPPGPPPPPPGPGGWGPRRGGPTAW